MTFRTRLVATLFACLAGSALVAAPGILAAPASGATTGAGIANITPYGGYLGNYIAPDGTRVYCIDPVLDWPSGITGDGVLTSSLTTSWGETLDADVLRKFDTVLGRYGQTDDPVLAAAVSAYLYGFTSGYARTYGGGVDAALHFINGEPEVEATFLGIWEEVEASSAPVPPSAEVTIEMSDADAGVVRISAVPADAAGQLILEGAVVADSGESTVAVSGTDSVAIVSTPEDAAVDYSIAATATFVTAAGPQPQVTLYETGSQQRTIRDSGAAPVEFASSARVEVTRPVPTVETPAPTLAETGLAPTGMLGAGVALVAAGLVVPFARRSREYGSRARVIPERD